jgi:transcriptional regulator with XRE-family HTH domain
VRNGLSIRKLAQLISCDKSSIVDWEQAKREPTPVYKERLSRYLGGTLRDRLFPASSEHMALRPEDIAEENWVHELQILYSQQCESMSQLFAHSDLRDAEIEERAAIFARQIQLWAHDVVPNPFGGGVHYKLTTNVDGEKEWVSNVREDPIDGSRRHDASGTGGGDS